MSAQGKQPSLQEMAEILKSSAQCLDCDAPECHEFTPGGVDVCARLPFWDNKPVTRPMLREWKAQLATQGDGKL
jgi:hypothetical protein